MENPETMIVGCGYVGRRVAALERGQGNAVLCLTRAERAGDTLRNLGYRVVTVDLDVPASIDIQGFRPDILYYFAPPPNTGSSDPRLSAFLERLESHQAPRRLVYISTSGVYGNCDGNWVDETRPANPQSDRAGRRWSAEQNVRAWSAERGVRAVILRVPGIYGPGRLPVDRLRQGVPVVRRDQSPFSNRIHVDDLAAICVAAGHVPSAGGVYNVSDGQPTTMTDYFLKAADALGLPHPPEISLNEARERFSPAMLSFLEESRRLDNRKMCVELGIRLQYGELERGLAASVEASLVPPGVA